MQLHKNDWEKKQERLVRIIKKKKLYRQDGLFEQHVEETGGIVPNNKLYLQEVDEELDEEELNEEEIKEEEIKEEEKTKCPLSEYIVLIITEYIKKEDVLENYIEAYKTVYNNIEQYYKSISKKEDIDFIVENNILKQKRKSNENVFSSSKNQTKIRGDEPYEKKEKHAKRDKLDGRGDSEGMEEVDIEMETYTVSVVIKLKKYILYAFPMLKEIITNLQTHTGKNYYINSRTGIIENWKQKIYEYSCAKKKMFSENKKSVHNIIKEKNYDIGYTADSCAGYNAQENYSNEMANATYNQFGYSYNQSLYQNRNDQKSFSQFNLQETLANEQNLAYEQNKWQIIEETAYTNVQSNTYGEIKPREYEENAMERRGHMNGNKLKHFGINRSQKYTSGILQNDFTIPGFYNYKIYEIKITTDRYLISLKSILVLIEFIALFHLYFKKSELEEKIHKQISWKELYKYKKIMKHQEINYSDFYNIILGEWLTMEKKGKGGEVKNTGEVENNGEVENYGEVENTGEESLNSQIEVGLSQERLKHSLNEHLQKKKKKNTSNWMLGQQKNGQMWNKKLNEKMYDYIKYMFENIIYECDFCFNIEFLYTLNIFQCTYFFNMFKNLLLQKNLEDSALIMLTYCAYKTNNRDMISHCFWRLISIFENDAIPSSWVRRDAVTHTVSNYNSYHILNSYNIVNAYPFSKSKDNFTMLKHIYSNCLFYEALNIIKDKHKNNTCEINVQMGNLYCKKNLIDKNIFGMLTRKVKKEFHMHNKIPNGYIINEVQRIRNFSEFYSCCYVLKNNKKEKILIGFKKKKENIVYIYKYDKNIKKKYKQSQTFFHMFGFLGVLVCNFTGMKIKIYDNGISENYSNFFPNFKRESIITISFDSNIISELPRHFVCNVYKENKLIQLVYENKCPIWNEEKEMYELPFYGRVKLASAKNLQLILKKCILSDCLKARFYGKTLNDMIEYIIYENNQKVAQAEISSDEEENFIGESPKTGSTIFPSNFTKHTYTKENVSEQEPHTLQNVSKSFSFDNLKNKMNHKSGTFEIINKDEEDIYLIFGKNSKDLFTLDFRHPLTSFESFAIAISSLLKKKAVS